MSRFEDQDYTLWARRIKELDRYICRICGKKYNWKDTENERFHSHHLNSWDIHINERYDINNGVCLCSRCHLSFHQLFGKGNNTRAQFIEFMKLTELIKTSAYKLKKDEHLITVTESKEEDLI